MRLSPGVRLGPYELTAALGAGGMGEVYRARDVRLDRTVAIKILCTAPVPDGDDGLEREARAIAALNHPHVCALHDVGRENGTPFLVMEYVEGQTLATRLRRGALPPRDVIRFGIQIAEALDHAHRHGVLHRDLKPSNIAVTRTGIKVLDFGLATLRAAAPASLPLDHTPAASRSLPSDEALLGTVHYMAPERLEGRRADQASDIFSFGAVMYEMATGRRAFEGQSPAAVIAAILTADPPPPSSATTPFPPALDWLILKALARQPEARWHSAGDIVEVLRWMARGPIGPHPEPARRRLLPAFGALLGAASLVAAAVVYRRVPPPPPSIAFSVLPPAGGAFTPTPSSVPSPQFTLSPDGRLLAFVASAGGDPSRIWVRRLNTLGPAVVPGTEGAQYPFWSPDGTAIAFFADGLLKRADLSGGPVQVIAPAPHGRGGTWNRDDVILFAPATGGGLVRVPASGGTPVPVTSPRTGSREASHRWPQFLPDGRHFIFFVQGISPEAYGIYIDDLERSNPQKLIGARLSAAFVAPGHLLYVSDDVLMAVPFDPETRRIAGDPFPIAPSVAGSSNFYAAFSASDTGLLAYASTAASAELVWLDEKGVRLGTAGAAAEYVDFRLSPHDQQLAISEVDRASDRPDIRVLHLLRGSKVRLTFDSATDASPIWSTDGREIVFRSNRAGVHELYRRPSNGSGSHAILPVSGGAKYPTDWMPDGRHIVYHAYQPETGSDIWRLSIDGMHAAPLVQTPFDEMQGQVSADGRWLAYASLESGRIQVYVQGLVEAAERWQVSVDGGSDPRWRGDGRELFFVSADSWLMAVDFSDQGPGTPRRLFQVRLPPPRDPYLSSYDVTADGRRFLVKLPVQDVTTTPIHLVTGWLSGRESAHLIGHNRGE